VDPEVFPEPLKFDPDRWNSLKLEDPFQFIPFSAGSRNCIGQHLGVVEIKVIVALFLKNFQFEVNHEVKFVMGWHFAAGPMDD
jgi:cytochrome P450